MAIVASAEGPLLEQILDATYDTWHEGLSRHAYGRYYAAQVTTAWGLRSLRRLALVEGDEVLASAKVYAVDAVLDGRDVRVVGLGAVFTEALHRGRGVARDLIERILEQSAADGADLALLFSDIGPGYYARLGFSPLPAAADASLRIFESPRGGAPATMVRAGADRDLADIAAMGEIRASAYRFHLRRDRDAVSYAIATKRLLAGLGSPGARELQFFVAEEGASAVAYVVISVRNVAAGAEWTIEECGDRDPTGARVGAILQVLLARNPAERRPSIRVWLPPGFHPPQIEIIDERPAAEVMMVRALTRAAESVHTLRAEDVMYWHGDVF
jgi:GNAT superfamily N-acetyltransferase